MEYIILSSNDIEDLHKKAQRMKEVGFEPIGNVSFGIADDLGYDNDQTNEEQKRVYSFQKNTDGAVIY